MLKEKYSSMLLGSNFPLRILTIRLSVTSPLHVRGDQVIRFVGHRQHLFIIPGVAHFFSPLNQFFFFFIRDSAESVCLCRKCTGNELHTLQNGLQKVKALLQLPK